MQLEENETAVNNPNKEVYTLAHCFKAQISKLMAKKYVRKCRELKGHTYKTWPQTLSTKIYIYLTLLDSRIPHSYDPTIL